MESVAVNDCILCYFTANSCNEPRPPLNSKLLLPCDVSFGSTCPVKCIKGYVLRGPNLMKCDIHHGAVTWNANVIKCEGL